MEKALERLNEIKPRRKKADRKFLKDTVLDLCFKAFREKQQGTKDFTQKGRERNRALLKEIPNQIKSIDKLLNFLEEYPEIDDDISYAIWKNLDSKPLSMVWLYASDFYSSKLLTRKTHHIKDLLIETRKEFENILQHPSSLLENSLYSCQLSSLKFYEPITTGRDRASDAITTGLLCALVALFRMFGDQTLKDGDWYVSSPGPITKGKNSYYDIVADIANAIIDPKHKLPDKKQLDCDKVRDRIRKLSPDVTL